LATPRKGRIFISYRRTDTSYAAGRIYDRLAMHFGEDAIFMDVEALKGGHDFVKVLEEAVQSCDVLIALIGSQWLEAKDEGGNRRLDDPEDYVRIEIATALNRDIRVIPVLVDGIDMPRSIKLPENLKPLVRRNALQVNHRSFNSDAYRLIAHIELALKTTKKPIISIIMEALAGIASKFSRFFESLKSIMVKAMPVFRVIGILGIMAILYWGGSLIIPNIVEAFPTMEPNITLTPTYTITSKPSTTPTPFIYRTSTIQPTFTEISTPTLSEPINYTVQEGDFLASIVDEFNLGDDGIELLLYLNPYNQNNGTGINPATQIVYPGQEILIPRPGMKLPTATPIANDLEPGTLVTYTIRAGDTLAGIASLYGSTREAIMDENGLTDPNAIFVGQQILVPANILTATP